MKYLAKIAFVLMAFSSQFAHADTGPFYVSYPGYCNIKQVYVNTFGDVYGTEVGCSSIIGAPLVGSFTVDGRVAVSTVSTSNTPCVTVYNTNGSLVGGCSAGSSVLYFPRGTYTVKEQARAGAQRAFNVGTEMPDTSQTQGLPPTNF